MISFLHIKVCGKKSVLVCLWERSVLVGKKCVCGKEVCQCVCGKEVSECLWERSVRVCLWERSVSECVCGKEVCLWDRSVFVGKKCVCGKEMYLWERSVFVGKKCVRVCLWEGSLLEWVWDDLIIFVYP